MNIYGKVTNNFIKVILTYTVFLCTKPIAAYKIILRIITFIILIILYVIIITLTILNFMTTVIDQKNHLIEILAITVHMYNLYGLPTVGIPIHEMGRIRDYRCMNWKINSVYVLNYISCIMIFFLCVYTCAL